MGSMGNKKRSMIHHGEKNLLTGSSKSTSGFRTRSGIPAMKTTPMKKIQSESKRSKTRVASCVTKPYDLWK
jgi:hypothetical protein